MSFQALYSDPLNIPPIQLGGATPQCFLCGSEVVFASMQVAGNAANVRMYVWDVDQKNWFPFPVDPVLVDPAIDNGRIMKRYVTGRSSNGVYLCFVTDADDVGDSVTISIRLTNSV